MTDSARLTDEQAARLARLSERRAASSSAPKAAPEGSSVTRAPSKRRQRHPAQGGRIAAAGIGATAMFSIVTLLSPNNPLASAGASQASAPTDTPAPPPAPAAPPVQVVVHWVPATPPPVTAVVSSTGHPGGVGRPATQAASEPAGPIVLTATPVVKTVTVPSPTAPPRPQAPAPSPAATPPPAPAPPPAATTSGSG